MRPQLDIGRDEIGAARVFAVDRVENVALVTEGIAEILAFRGRMVQLVRRGVLAEPIAAVIG
jgi:hypothetical protein